MFAFVSLGFYQLVSSLIKYILVPRLFHSLNLLLTAEYGVAVGIKCNAYEKGRNDEPIKRINWSNCEFY